MLDKGTPTVNSQNTTLYDSQVENGQQGYGASSIEYYQGAEAVRKRPGMYIGDVDSEQGVLNMTTEIIDNSIDEYLAGYGNNIIITLEEDEAITVEDFGRGIPVDIHKSGVSAFELVLSQLHAGGKFNHSSYKISGGTHGVGAAVVIALSKEAEAHTVRNGKIYSLRFSYGKKVGEMTESHTEKVQGTIIRFLPDSSIFSVTNINYTTLLNRLNEIAYLNSKLKITLIDKKYNHPTKNIHHSGGIVDFWKKLAKSPMHSPIQMELREQGSRVEIQMGWQDHNKEEIKAFTNNIYQSAGGTHLTGLRHGVTKIILKHYHNMVPQNQQVEITGEDIRCGLTTILSIYLPDPKFASQTKDMLSSKEARVLVEKTVSEFLDDWIHKNPGEARKIFMHISRCANMRISFQKKKEIIDNKKHDLSTITHKFSNCQSNDPKQKELIIVEGESAGGSAKMGRNPKFQAILCLQGKLLNVEKAAMGKFLESKEFSTLINVLNCGVGPAIDIERIAFHKIIIMTDADVDGSHIRTLMLTFFFKYMPEVILRGYLYIARPPLYSVNYRSKTEYVFNSQRLKYYVYDNFVAKMRTNEQFNMENYFALLEYKKLIQEYFQDINHLFVSRLIMGGIIKVAEARQNLEEKLLSVQNNFPKTENSSFSIKLKELDGENNLTVYMQYKSFYTKHTTNILFACGFCEKIKPLLEKIMPFFQKYLVFKRKDQEYSFDEPLNALNFIDETMRSQIHLHRYKGLGEMDAEELAETSLDPKNRIIEQVFFDEESLEETSRIFQILLGDNVAMRKSYIFENYDYEAEEEANSSVKNYLLENVPSGA